MFCMDVFGIVVVVVVFGVVVYNFVMSFDG